jgi:hypothetical protein
MDKKDDDVFVIAGLSEQDVRKWQKEKKLDNVADKALVQLYSKVVLKKKLSKPYPIYPVVKIWEEINLINSGQKPGASRKLFVGIKDAVVIGLLRAITYIGCPECLKSAKKIGASKCAAHGSSLVDLETLSWNEWLIYDDADEFTIKMSPKYMHDYNELNMSAAKIYVEGVIDLDQDPIMMMVTNVRSFEPGKLMAGVVEDEDGAGDDFTVGRDDVDFAGFDDEEEESISANPFLDEEDDIKIVTPAGKNGVSEEFKVDCRKEFKNAMHDWAENPVRKIQVEKFMLDWIEEKYPMEFSDEEEAVKKLWELANGLYLDVGNEKIQRLEPKDSKD